MKHYSIRSASHGEQARPWLLFDVKFDIRDIRSRISETLETKFQAQLLPLEGDLTWAPDMVIERRVDFLEKRAQEIAPPPGFNSEAVDGRSVETKFLEYLLRHHKIVVQRNAVYDLYSSPSEPPEDFLQRCREKAVEDMIEEFRSIYDRYHRRLRQLEDSMMRAAEATAEGDEEKLAHLKLELGRVFLELKEDISTLFLEPSFANRLPRSVSCENIPAVLDLSEKLDAFQKELYSDLVRLKHRYKRRAESIEPFQLPLTLQQVDVAGSAILWQ
ncbi:MAG TPA: hypothetical protein VGL91_05650 [Acidobacteriota bacterium]|jgi:hypothetical protein